MDNNPTPPNDPKEPTYSHDDIRKLSFDEIAENKELPKEEPDKKEEKPEEKPEDKKPDEKPEEKSEEKEEEEVIDPEVIAEKAVQKVVERLTPEEKKDTENKYQQFFDKTVKEKGREPNWIELSEFLEEQAEKKFEARQKETQEAQKKAEEEKKKIDEAFTKRFNAQVDEELQELYDKKLLSPIENKDNPSDQGVVERKALFQTMLEVNSQRISEGKEPIASVARIFHNYYTKPNTQPAGEDAPVSIGKGTPGGESEEELNYIKDVKRPWSLFRKTP